MTIFSLTSVPQSLQTLHLLEFLLFIGTSIFLGYITAFLGSHIFALYFSVKSKTNTELQKISNNFILPYSKSYLTHFGLGIFPFIAILFIFTQFIKPENTYTLSFFELSLIIFIVSTLLSLLQNNVIKKTQKLNFPLLLITIISLFTSLWLFSSSFVYNLQPNNNAANITSLKILFSLDNLIFTVFLLLFSISISSITFLFFNKYSENYKLNEDFPEALSKENFNNILNIFAYTSMSLPVFYLLFVFTSNRTELSFNSFWSIISILLLVLTIRLSLIYRANSKNTYLRLSYIFFIFFLLGLMGLNTDAFSNSSKATILSSAAKYEEHNTEIASNEPAKQDNNKIGEDIFFAKCTNCHRDDTKFVGPSFKDMLAKYKNKKEEMIKFVLNPKKIDPNYPAMPNQGLKALEAEAVVNYIFKEYDKK